MKKWNGWRSSWKEMKTRTAFFFIFVLFLSGFFSFAATIRPAALQEKDKAIQAPAQQPPAKDKAVQDQIQAQPERIVAGPRNVKERTAIYVFIAWLWAAIIVLIYITRLGIKEADRLLELKFYRGEMK